MSAWRYLVDCNPEACRVHGYTREEMLSFSVYDLTDTLLSEEERKARESAGGTLWQRAIAGDSSISDNLHRGEHKRKDGTTFPVEVLVGSVNYAGRRLVLASVRDITERKRIEDALRESEARFRTLVQYGSDVISILEVDGTIRYESPAIERVLGYRPEEMVGTNAFDYVHPEDLEQVLDTFREGIATGEPTPAAGLRLRHSDGSWRHLESIGVSLLEDPAVQGIIVNSRDITERKQAEKELYESEERYRSLVELSPDAIAVHSEGEVVYVNAAGAELFGASGPEELVGRKALDFVHPDYRGVATARIRAAMQGEPASLIEEKYIRLDGSVIDVEIAGMPVSYLGKPAVQVVLRDTTERKRIEEALRESERRLRAIFEGSGVGISIADLDRRLLETNPAYQEMTGYSEEELFGKPIAELSHPDDVSADTQSNSKLLSGELDRYQREKRYTRKDGEVIWVKPTVSVVRGTGGEPMFLVGVVENITERRQAEIALRESEERFRQLFEHSVDLLFVHDDKGRIFECNTEACQALGYTREEMLDSTVGDIAAKLLTKEERRMQEGETLWERAMRSEPGGIVGFEQNELRRKDGSTFPVEIGVGTIDYGGRRMIFASARDITRRKELEEQLTYQAFHDSLTYLPNRALFLERLDHALARLARRQSQIAVLFMDLDNFKVVNDSLGHELGDRLLQAVAERLKICLRPEDTVARFGGDEFTMLLEDIKDVEEAKRVAGRISEALMPPFEIQQQQVFANISIGIAVGASAQDDSENLLRNADAAMYEAKRNGKAQYMVFEPSMIVRLQERLELETDLTRGIENNEFVVYYQPKILIETGKVCGLEALVRWEHPSRGIVSPKQFIPLAEETGLILPIERMVLENACRSLSEWRKQYSSSLVVSVNLYQRQLQQPDLIEQITKRLHEANLAPDSLMLEVTEEVVMKDEEPMLATLQTLKSHGIKLAIDDFGMGYSSLDYLKRLPVDYLKIDRSFIEGLEEDRKDQIIVSSAINLAHALELKVIAEGVETAEQLRHLRELGCDQAQGYYFARALTKDAIPAFLASGSTNL